MAQGEGTWLWWLLGGTALAAVALTRKVDEQGTTVLDSVVEGVGKGVSYLTARIGKGFFDPGLASGNWRPYVDDLEDLDIWNAPMPDPETFGILTDPSNRSAHAYNLSIDQFDVEHNPRYTPNRIPPRETKPQTFCNIFVQDVMRANGIVVPWGNANAMADYLNRQLDGWVNVSAPTAQDRASAGYPTIAYWKNPAGAGHVSVVRPGAFSATYGPMSANAGAGVYNNAPVGDRRGFGTRLLPLVMYATHD